MRTVIVGAGAMGCLFGARLSTVTDLYLINLDDSHGRVLREDGLRMVMPNGDKRHFRLTVVHDPEDAPFPADLAIIFTKSYDTRSGAESAARMLTPNGMALTLQNGLGNMEVIESVIGKGRIAAGITLQACAIVDPGVVRYAGGGGTALGSPDHGPDVSPVVDLFSKAGFETERSEDIFGLIWGKLIVNAGINALAAILRVPNGKLAELPACDALMAEVVREAVAVAEALNIRLPYDDPVSHVRSVCEKTAENRASMLQDMLRGSRTEIDVINGAIAREGEKVGVPTPANALIAGIIRALEATSAHRIRE